LDRAKSYRYIEVDVENFPLLALMIHVIEGYNFLIELEEVNFIRTNLFHLILILLSLRSIQHSYTCLSKVVRHGKLRVPIKAYILLVLTLYWWLVVDAIDVVLGSTIITLCPSLSTFSVSMGVRGVGCYSSAIVRP
jgi:hypothetical protein